MLFFHSSAIPSGFTLLCMQVGRCCNSLFYSLLACFLGPAKKHRVRGPSFKIGRVSLNAKTLLATLKELEPLDDVLPADPAARKKWVLDFR